MVLNSDSSYEAGSREGSFEINALKDTNGFKGTNHLSGTGDILKLYDSTKGNSLRGLQKICSMQVDGRPNLVTVSTISTLLDGMLSLPKKFPYISTLCVNLSFSNLRNIINSVGSWGCVTYMMPGGVPFSSADYNNNLGTVYI
jgi:hypothetical protein